VVVFGAIVFLSSASVDAQDLEIGLMPAVDSIPLLIAQDQGFFADEGIDVELRMFRNQLYRETALQTNEIDGSISDLINAVYNWRNRTGVQVGSITDGHFALVTAADSGLTSIAEWNRRDSLEVGLLENSIIYYVAERMLEAAGGKTETIELVTTLQVPTRMEMVVAGQIEAALLPEPVTRIAAARGSNILLDSSVLEQTPGVLVFTERARGEKSKEIRALYRAYNRAVEAINADPDSFRSTIVRLGEFPPTVEKSMVVPTYERARRPTAAELLDVTDWMVEKGLIESSPDYSAVVASGLLP
jgi:NitT/TauT family transport system substrate-binding protein